MPFLRPRALRLCALLVLPAGAFAQSTKGPTIFAQSTQVGTVNLRAAVVHPDYSVQPLALLKVVAVRTDRPDSASLETDLDGRVVMPLRVGTYTLRARTSQPVSGRVYAWAVSVVVRPQRTEMVQFTNSNAMVSDSVVTAQTAQATPVAPSQPAPKPASQPPAPKAAPTPIQVAPSPFTPPTKPAQAQAKHVEKPVARTVSSRPRANTSGLIVGLSFDASRIQSRDFSSSAESGPGAAAQFGWGFTRNFALVLDGSGARISSLGGDYNLAHLDLAGRWHFVNRTGFVPFVEVGWAARALTKNDALLTGTNGMTYAGNVAVLGSGASFGGGVEYFATRSWALGGTFKWTTGNFSRVKVDNVAIDGFKIDATSARLNMGFSWYPMAGK